MKKQKFVELIKSPEKISANDFAELEQLLMDSPYFQSGHTVLAKGSRILKKQSAGHMTKRAAMYATNRDIFKKFLMSQTRPVSKPAPPQPPISKRTQPKPQDTKAPNLLSKTDQEKLISEIYENLEKWKSSRDQYLEYDKAHPEEIVILPVDSSSAPIPEGPQAPEIPSDSVQNLKDQIAEELEIEEKIEETISKQEIPQPTEDEPSAESIPTDEIMGIAEEIKNEVAREEEIKGDQTEEAKEEIDEGDMPKVESIENVDVPSIYNFGSAPVAEEPPEEIKDSGPTPESTDVISTDELSAIVDESEELKEDSKEEGAPDIESIEGLDDIDIDDGVQEIVPELNEPADESPDLEIKEVPEVSHEAEAKEEKSDKGPVIESVDEIDISEIDVPGLEPEEDEPPVVEAAEISAPPSDEPSIPEPEPIAEEEEIEDEEEPEPVPEPAGETEDEIKLDIQIDEDKSTEETEAELSKLDAEKQELKLQPGQFSRSKKFRVSVLTKPIQFKKQGKTVQPLSAEGRREKAAKAEEIKEKISQTVKEKGAKKTSAKKTAAKSTAKKATPKKASTAKKTAAKKATATAKKSAATKKTSAASSKATAKKTTTKAASKSTASSTKKKATTKAKAAEVKKTTKKVATTKATAKKTPAKKKTSDSTSKKKKS